MYPMTSNKTAMRIMLMSNLSEFPPLAVRPWPGLLMRCEKIRKTSGRTKTSMPTRQGLAMETKTLDSKLPHLNMNSEYITTSEAEPRVTPNTTVSTVARRTRLVRVMSEVWSRGGKRMESGLIMFAMLTMVVHALRGCLAVSAWWRWRAAICWSRDSDSGTNEVMKTMKPRWHTNAT